MPKSTIYFVNSINGNDENAGLSESTAFKSLKMINELSLMPGDKVMLAKGSVFENEFLHIKNCGDINGDLIEITSYGDGDLPKINANGNGIWHQDLVVIRNAYSIDDNLIVNWNPGKFEVLVYANKDDVDYTNKFSVELRDDEEQLSLPPPNRYQDKKRW